MNHSLKTCYKLTYGKYKNKKVRNLVHNNGQFAGSSNINEKEYNNAMLGLGQNQVLSTITQKHQRVGAFSLHFIKFFIWK